MNIEYVGRNFEVGDALRQQAQDKLDKVGKFLAEPVDVRVTCEAIKHQHRATLHVHHKLGNLESEAEAGDMTDALGSALDKLEKQARRSRKKLTDRKRRYDGAEEDWGHWPMDVVESSSVGDEDGPRIIRSTRLRIKPMTVEDAAFELEDSKNEFIVFRNASSDRINVLYRRKDSHYGLIAPEL
jgi:putative sigma-54 modulation protein